jgi:hypothetical protein
MTAPTNMPASLFGRVSYDVSGKPVPFVQSNLREILRQKKAQKRRNPFCISSFCNAFMTQNFLKVPQMSCGAALIFYSVFQNATL